MEYYTTAYRFYRENRIPIRYNANEDMDDLNAFSERLMVILIQKGSGIVTIDGCRLSLVAPCIFCINENESVHMEAKGDWAAQSISFSPIYINSTLNFDQLRKADGAESTTQRQDLFLLRPFIRKSADYKGVISVDSVTMSRLTALFNRGRNKVEEQSHRTWSCSARGYFMELLFILARLYDTPEQEVNQLIGSSSTWVDDVVLYLSCNYDKRISISELCAVFNTNKTTLQREFKRATGQSVMAYLSALRVKLATLMLMDTSVSIAHISERLGFCDSTHFYKTFLKLTGYSPAKYRKDFRRIKA